MVANNGPDALSGDDVANEPINRIERVTGAKTGDDAAVEAVLRQLERVYPKVYGDLTVDERTKIQRDRARWKETVNQHRTLPAVLDAAEALVNEVESSPSIVELREALHVAEVAYEQANKAYQSAIATVRAERSRISSERSRLSVESTTAYPSAIEQLCRSSSLWARIEAQRGTIRRLEIDPDTGGQMERVVAAQLSHHESLLAKAEAVLKSNVGGPWREEATETVKTSQAKIIELTAKLERHRNDLEPFRLALDKLVAQAVAE